MGDKKNTCFVFKYSAWLQGFYALFLLTKFLICFFQSEFSVFLIFFPILKYFFKNFQSIQFIHILKFFIIIKKNSSNTLENHPNNKNYIHFFRKSSIILKINLHPLIFIHHLSNVICKFIKNFLITGCIPDILFSNFCFNICNKICFNIYKINDM